MVDNRKIDENKKEINHQINLFLFDDFYSLNEEYFKKRIKKIQPIYKIDIINGLLRTKSRNEELTPDDIIREYKDSYDNDNYKGYSFFITNGKIQNNYYRKTFNEKWEHSYGSVISFYQLDDFIKNWALLNEHISRFIIIQIFKNIIKKNINCILLNYGFNKLDLFHRKDSGKCIFNFAEEKEIVAFEVNDPIICGDCEKQINVIVNNKKIDKSIRVQIKNEFNLLNKIILKLKYPSLFSYLIEKLFYNPIGSFIFGGLIFGTIINLIFYILIYKFEYLIYPTIILLTIIIILILLCLIISYYSKKKIH